MSAVVSIHQIYFDDKTRKELDRALIPYHNTRQDGYFENSVIKELYDRYKNGQQENIPQYLGTTSWKQKQRTGLDGSEIISHITNEIQSGTQKDVYLFTPVSNIEIRKEGVIPPQYEYNGVIRERDLWSIHKSARPEAYRVDILLDESGVLPFKLLDGQWCFSHSNYWVARKEVFDNYCEKVLLPIMQWFERPDIKVLTSSHDFIKGNISYPIYSCVLEATFGAFLAHSDYSYSYICHKKTGRRRYSKINIVAFECIGDVIPKTLPVYRTEKIPKPSGAPANNLPTVNPSVIKEERIGIYLQRFKTGEAHCASDRIRGEWVAKNSDDKMEIYNSSKKYRTIIFHYPCKEMDLLGDVKILDVCDPVWKDDVPQFLEYIKKVSAIIVPTNGLKEDLEKITNKKIYVISDGHDSEHYASVIKPQHLEAAKEVVWFGYAENSHCLLRYLNTIKDNKLKLKVISQRQNEFPLTIADEFVKWDVNTYLHEIAKSDFAILPEYNKLKSNNKEITALLCGVPVAKTIEDVYKLISPEERLIQLESKANDISEYDAKKTSQQYLNIISEIEKPKPVEFTVYSSITGNYEKVRNDIKIFPDGPADKFRIANMNAKIYKVLSHKYISSKYSIWVDGNIMINVNEQALVDEFLGYADIAVFAHPRRKCIYTEHPEARNRVAPEFFSLMDEQVNNYRREGMPANFGLAECGMIIRRNTAVVEEFNEKWWAEICTYTQRDQMSFPYVWWKMKDRININLVPGNVREHSYFKYFQR